ncbi:DnaJ family domain-containing protein [Neobacillus sp. NPDC097160]|uniref:DnaJ family domain-containing protein n=1 Tax=Neobacillus sp. NPDC097160 TaxID=3364298 RepID=UPI0037FB835F
MSFKKEGHDQSINQKSGDYNLDEEMKNHPGFGKPLPSHLFSGDIYANFTKTAKEAGYLPPFVALQKEIREAIAKVMKIKAADRQESEVKGMIDEINKKIQKYNTTCPPMMQKGRVGFTNIENQIKNWE